MPSITSQQTLSSLEAEDWTEHHLDSQPREVLFAQLLHPAITAPRGEPQRRRMGEIAELQPGGLFQGTRPWLELRGLFEEAAESCAIPPIVSGDYECRVAIEEGISCGTAMNVGAVKDLEQASAMAYAVGKNCAMQGRAVGTRWTFAPVADVNINPENPITNVRAFSDDPRRVGALCAAFVRGCQEHGMAATLKHFPGDGLDSVDQHVCPSINPLSLERWREVCAPSFHQGLEAGAWSVMMGHLLFPALNDRDPSTGELLPATISPAAHRLLREEFGFEGVIVSDAIGMGGLAWQVPDEADAVVRNLAAGSDMVLLPERPEIALRAILHAVDEGLLDEEALLRSVRRILELKTKLGLHRSDWGLLDRESSERLFSSPDHGPALQLAEASVTLLHDSEGAYPSGLSAGDHVVLFDLPLETPQGVKLVVAGQEDRARLECAMTHALRERGISAVTVQNPEEFRAEVSRASAVIYRFHARPQAGRNSIRLAYQALQFIEQTRQPTTLKRFYVSLGSPYILRELPALRNLAVIYASVPSCEEAFVRTLLGEKPFAGKCPVTWENPALS